ncbi:hypothetical protein EV361DRAFT_921508 [Lentinula raphanica]|uniref:Uncharacterized protein n=1 Tax=Lentinula raphanica TaxID=153919 RepID=A0AA38U882_9AGAR|nr:hypothetical protein C8R42DRAFT_778940 [Lentinula raphanica]KAJ3775826.1 hypothetical protein FB446DRAFT_723852 [Lentinula raphanica]KAJ3818694.1 hypothetical protein F5880DRAFT_1598665 [Lentinula raphanica]KAJ3833986.1 hypothetical protein F5878DRAFT_631605 [Lentinula raphanica]KAJ3969345.1 hypothetical protein EV361DRAFT_921508 [Lentinula raphanica]
MKFITALVYAASLLFISASAQTSCHTKDDCSGGDLCCWGSGRSPAGQPGCGEQCLTICVPSSDACCTGGNCQ